MAAIMGQIKGNLVLFLVLGFANVLLASLLLRIFYLPTSRRVMQALGTRKSDESLYRRCSRLLATRIGRYERLFEKGGFYRKTRQKLRKAGYNGEYAAILYLAVKLVVTPAVFIAALAVNYPDIIRPLISIILINSILESVMAAGKRKINLRFQKYIYKIYKYLHNQISSGVKPTDAVRTVYEIVDDHDLKQILTRLAARYELTLDIDTALAEFRSHFDVHEAETLCIALKQGIDTGDNKDLLSRQEDIMFKKYFNYIQAETDSCRNRSIAAAAVFVFIVSVMIIVPMLNEMGKAIGKIFIN